MPEKIETRLMWEVTNKLQMEGRITVIQNVFKEPPIQMCLVQKDECRGQQLKQIANIHCIHEFKIQWAFRANNVGK